MGLWYQAKTWRVMFLNVFFVLTLSPSEKYVLESKYFFFVPQEINVFVNSDYFEGLFLKNGDKDAKIFPHIRFRIPSPHLYLAPVLTFPSGCRTVVRDYWQPSSCSPALSCLSLLLSLLQPLLSLFLFVSSQLYVLIRLFSRLPVLNILFCRINRRHL